MRIPLNASLVAQVVNNPPAMQETQGTQVQSPVGEDPGPEQVGLDQPLLVS